MVIADCYEVTADGLRLRLKVTPKSRRNGPQGYVALADGGCALRLGINAPPEDGRANAAIVSLLAKRMAVAKSAISVVSGAKDRRKLVDIRGRSSDLAEALEAWLAGTLEDQHEAEEP